MKILSELQIKLESITKHKIAQKIKTIAGVLIFFISVTRLIDFIRNGEYLAIFLALGFVVFCSIFIARRLKIKEYGPPVGKKFSGVGLAQLNIKNAWRRQDEVKTIIGKLVDDYNDKKITIITGASGSGKSTIVKFLMKNDLRQRGFRASIISDYGNIQTKLYNLLDSELGMQFTLDKFTNLTPKIGFKSENKNHVIVFDQFENYLQGCLSKDIDTRNCKINWFCNTCKDLIKSNLKILVVIRKEFFVDILVLKKFLKNGYFPHIKDILEIKGVKYTPSSGFVYSKLRDVTQNEGLTNLIWSGILNNNNELLPVEAQIIGLMIEYGKAQQEINLDEYYGIEMVQSGDSIQFKMPDNVKIQYERTLSKLVLINNYFTYFLLDSPNKDISMEVLFALSSRSFLRKTIKSSEIALYVHRKQDDVIRCLNYFEKHNLIIREDNGEYRWAHDYLAEKYHEYSGSIMMPISRDNISYFCSSTDAELLDQITPISHEKGKTNLRRALNYLAMGLLSLLIIGRFIAPVYNIDWSWFNILSPYQKMVWDGKFFDVFYFPVFLSHFAWSYYITIYYDRFLSFLKENFFQKVLSFATVVVCFLCVLYSTFEPYAFLISIGMGGLIAGIRTFCLSRRLVASETAQSYFVGFSMKTMVNSLILIFIGVGHYILEKYLAEFYASSDVTIIKKYLTIDTGIALFITLIMIYGVYFVKHQYSKAGTAILLGIYDRVKR